MKKVGFLIGIMVIFTALFVSCAGNGGNPDGNNDEVNISVNEVELIDGIWDYSENMPLNCREYGTFEISNNGTTFTFLNVWEGINNYGDYLNDQKLSQKNSVNNFPHFQVSTTNNDEDHYYEIKSNSNHTKYNFTYTYKDYDNDFKTHTVSLIYKGQN